MVIFNIIIEKTMPKSKNQIKREQRNELVKNILTNVEMHAGNNSSIADNAEYQPRINEYCVMIKDESDANKPNLMASMLILEKGFPERVTLAKEIQIKWGNEGYLSKALNKIPLKYLEKFESNQPMYGKDETNEIMKCLKSIIGQSQVFSAKTIYDTAEDETNIGILYNSFLESEDVQSLGDTIIM